jgi:RNA ligase (TIGR02306 family)
MYLILVYSNKLDLSSRNYKKKLRVLTSNFLYFTIYIKTKFISIIKNRTGNFAASNIVLIFVKIFNKKKLIMSNWKVSKEKISIFAHPKPDVENLVVGKVGNYQIVVQKGLYEDGEEVVFAPEKSILTGAIKEQFEKYLVGSEKNRIKSIRLQGEISCGVIVPKHLVPNLESIEIGEDISELLGITKYEPPIPKQLMGKVATFNMPHIGSHDCEHAAVYANDLVNGERVIITEKVHGSQFILAHNIETNETLVSSKGLLKSGLSIQEDDVNVYWMAARNDQVVEKIKRNFDSGVVQVFGEVIPVQKGYTYGAKDPIVLLFDVRFYGISIPYDQVPDDFSKMWVPVLFDFTDC